MPADQYGAKNKREREAAERAFGLVQRHAQTLPEDQRDSWEDRARDAALKAVQLVRTAGRRLIDDNEEILRTLNPEQIFRASDLLIWKHPVRRIQCGLGPPTDYDSCPILHGDDVITWSFSPGRVYALDRDTGRRIWKHRLTQFGQVVVSDEGYLVAGNCKSLLSLNPETGATMWKFTPAVPSSERIYSVPVMADGSLFFGDRSGRFYCLSAATGIERWSVQTSRSHNADVNATALVFEDLVITANNANLVLAYDRATGREVWRRRLKQGSIFRVLLYQGMILVRSFRSLYGLSPKRPEQLFIAGPGEG